MDNLESNIRNNTCNGKCSRCGECCGLFIPFTDKEIKKIKRYVKQNNIQPIRKIDTIKEGYIDIHCCFYDDINHKCLIYPVRPYVCQDFICNRENWKEKRDYYESRTRYNSTIHKYSIISTLDEQIYGDRGSLIFYISMLCKDPNGKGLDSYKFVQFLEKARRLDLLKYISYEDDKGVEQKGTKLLEEHFYKLL